MVFTSGLLVDKSSLALISDSLNSRTLAWEDVMLFIIV